MQMLKMETRNTEAVKKREDESALTEKDYMTMEIVKLKKEIETLRKEKDEVELINIKLAKELEYYKQKEHDWLSFP